MEKIESHTIPDHEIKLKYTLFWITRLQEGNQSIVTERNHINFTVRGFDFPSIFNPEPPRTHGGFTSLQG